jgi:cytochrome c oxidase subunit IV
MSEPTRGNPYAIYWKTWVLLLIVTVAMLASESFHMPRILLIAYLLIFMMVKASMIGGNFMHLRYENLNLVIIVAAGLLVTSLILFLFIAPETHSVLVKSLP